MITLLDQITKSSLKFLEPQSLSETYKTIVEEAVKLTKAEGGSIVIMQGRRMQRVWATNPLTYKIPPRKKGFTYKVYKTRKSAVLKAEEIAKIHPLLREINVKAIILIPLYYKRKSIGVLSVHSVCKAKFSEQELGTLELFGTFASLAILKTQLYEETQKSLETRDLFISMAAHEMRTPVTTLNIYSELLKNRLKKSPDSQEARWIEEISWEVSRIKSLINELLVVNRIKTGILTYDFKEISIRELLGKCLYNFQLTHADYIVQFKDLEPRRDKIIGDFEKLVQVILNVLENAAKYSLNTEVITVSLRANSKYFVINVTDKGQGIPKKDLPHIFEGFYRGKTDGELKGMGLGLFLSHNIIKKHHGKITVKSRIGKGTEVEINLPRAKYDK